MSNRIRVFISSTMRDLANERDAVERAVRGLNFEPVSAEGWLPNGSSAWERIEKEIASSDIFVLLIGERYGWSPESGPRAGEGKSVTHLEVLRARDLGLPILPFLKRLAYDAPRDTHDAQRRDALREEVAAWKDGHLATEFDLASDLEGKVLSSLVGVMAEAFRNRQNRERAQRAGALARPPGPVSAPLPVLLPPALVEHARRRRVLLFAGAGMSLLAGYPSALATSQALADWVKQVSGEEPSLEGVPVRALAERFEAAFGRAALLDVLAAVNSQPRGVDPTPAHRYAVRLVDLIVTTNFDPLFEVAAREGGIAFSRVIPPEGFGWPSERQVIVKILGAIEERHTMVATERDLRRAIESEPYCTVLRLARELPLLVVGTSLRDEAQKVIL